MPTEEVTLLWWRNQERPDGGLYVLCNDLFAWACADAEEITPENINLLRDAIRDASDAKAPQFASDLFCARARGERPQGAAYPANKPEYAKIRELLDVCGPEREIDFCNPKDQNGEYKYTQEMHDRDFKKIGPETKS